MRIVYDIDEPWQCGGGGKPYIGSKGGRIELVICGEVDALHIHGDAAAIVETLRGALDAATGLKECLEDGPENQPEAATVRSRQHGTAKQRKRSEHTRR